MRGKTLTQNDIRRIIHLRRTGHSLPEIKKITGKSNSVVSKYIQGVSVLPEFVVILREKQGGSRARAQRKWEDARKSAEGIVGALTHRERLLVLVGLYWGEGTKKELSIINGDPELIRVSARCLKALGVKKEDFSLTLRIFSDMYNNKDNIATYWTRLLGVSQKQIAGFNVIEGKRSGKLPYGMCRLRIRRGESHFKLLMSMIDLVKSGI